MQYHGFFHREHEALFVEVRTFLLGFDGVTENLNTRSLSYADKYGGLCHLRTIPAGVEVGFFKGVYMQDELGLLRGDGKYKRNIYLHEMDETALLYYMIQALELNKGRF